MNAHGIMPLTQALEGKTMAHQTSEPLIEELLSALYTVKFTLESVKPTTTVDELRDLWSTVSEAIAKAEGCEHCNGTGLTKVWIKDENKQDATTQRP